MLRTLKPSSFSLVSLFGLLLLLVVIGGGAGSAQAASYSFAGLGDLPGGSFSSHALGISADGSVVVGRGNSSSETSDPFGTYEAFRWTEAGGMVGLGDLTGGGFGSLAHSTSARHGAPPGYLT